MGGKEKAALNAAMRDREAAGIWKDNMLKGPRRKERDAARADKSENRWKEKEIS